MSSTLMKWNIYLTHQFGRLDFSTSSNNLTFTDTLRLRSHRKRVLQVFAKDDVLDEHGLNLDTPSTSNVLDYL